MAIKPQHTKVDFALIVALLSLAIPALTSGCGSEEELAIAPPPGHVDLETLPEEDDEAQLELLNPRALRFDSNLLGRTRTCRLLHVGTVENVQRRSASFYRILPSRRATVRCATERSSGLAELTISKELVEELDDLGPGREILVRGTGDRGVRDLPVIELVGMRGEWEAHRRSSPIYAAVPSGADFGDSSVDFGVCAVEHVAHPTRLEEGLLLPLACRHAAGNSWITLRLEERDLNRALDIERGTQVSVERANGRFRLRHL